MSEQYTVNEPDSPLRKKAIDAAVSDIKRIVMMPEAIMVNAQGEGGVTFVRVHWGAVKGVTVQFPTANADHARAIIDAINAPLVLGVRK